jgi:hypothetical protein
MVLLSMWIAQLLIALQTTVAEQAKWAAIGRRIIFADANSDCHRKERDAGCVTFAYTSAHGVASRLLLSSECIQTYMIDRSLYAHDILERRILHNHNA